MTTQVTIKASGPCYPVRITKIKAGKVIENRLLAGGDTTEFYLPGDVHLSVQEEYHKDGFTPQ